jgi:hypothetical protein
MTAPAPAATTWRRTRLASGALRLQHLPSGSIVFLAKGASEAEIARRLAEIEATIARLIARRSRS